MCRPRTIFYLIWPTDPPGLEFCGSGPACSTSWLGMVNAGWLGSTRSKTFLKINFSLFRAGPPNKQPFYLGYPLHIISSFFSHLYLFQNTIFKLGFWNFKAIFPRMQILLVRTFFSLVLVICLSWYLHLKLSHEFLLFISFTIWRLKLISRTSYLILWKSNGLPKHVKSY